MSEKSEHFPELPASPGRIAALSLLALVAGIAVSWWIDRPPGPECSGCLCVRSTTIHARNQCTVASLVANEGEIVHIGDPLVNLEDDRLQAQIVAKQLEISSLQSQLDRVQAQAELEIKWRMRTLESEICEIQLRSANYLKEKYDFDMQRTMLTEMLSNTKPTASVDPQTPLKQVALENSEAPPERLSTIVKLEAAANASDVSAAQLEICSQREQQLKELKENLPAQVKKTLGVEIATSNLSRAQSELEQLQQHETDLAVKSPSIGRVGVYTVAPGDHLEKGDPIVELLDGSKRFLKVDVPSQSITRFAQGTEVTLIFPGGDSRKGEVTQVAPQTSTGIRAGSDVIVQVQVEPQGAVWPDVPIGSRVRVRPAK